MTRSSTLLGDELDQRGYSVGAPRRGGLERGGDPVPRRSRRDRRRRARVRPASRTRRRAPCRRPAAGSGSSRSTCRTAASRDSDHYRYKLAWLAALRETCRRRARGHDRGRRHEHRADRRRRFRSRGLRGPHSRHRARAGGAGGASRRSACTTWCAIAGPTRECSPTGITGPGCSTRTSGCGSTWSSPATRSRTASRRRGSTARRARAAVRATTRR